MVYCPKCGKQNEDDADYCSKCGYNLGKKWKKRKHDGCFNESDDYHEECFGVPHGGLIVGIMFGIILILLGLSAAFGIDLGRYIGPLVMVVIGALIITGAYLAYKRRR